MSLKMKSSSKNCNLIWVLWRESLLPNRAKNEMSPRLQLQPLSQLAAGVNKLEGVNKNRIKLEQEDREEIVKCWQEEAAKIETMKMT